MDSAKQALEVLKRQQESVEVVASGLAVLTLYLMGNLELDSLTIFEIKSTLLEEGVFLGPDDCVESLFHGEVVAKVWIDKSGESHLWHKGLPFMN